jgi:hypothetical protein
MDATIRRLDPLHRKKSLFTKKALVQVGLQEGMVSHEEIPKISEYQKKK